MIRNIILSGILLTLTSMSYAFEGAYDKLSYRDYDKMCNSGGPSVQQLCQFYINGAMDSLRTVSNLTGVSKKFNVCPENFSWKRAGDAHKLLLETPLADKTNVPAALFLIYLRSAPCEGHNDLVENKKDDGLNI